MADIPGAVARAIPSAVAAVRHFFSDIQWNPLGWDAQTWELAAMVLTALLLLSLLLRRRRPATRLEAPELFISSGELVPLDDTDTPTLPSSAYRLTMNVSNLNSYPVQLLEFTLESDEVMNEAIVVELPTLIAAETSVELTRQVPKLAITAGTLSLYLYTPTQAQRYFQHRATFEWQSWRRRYRISPLRQETSVAKLPAHSAGKREQKPHWQRPAEPERGTRAEEARRAWQEAEKLQPKAEGGLRFPDDF